MWEDEIAVVRRGYDAFNVKDAEAYVALCHPEVHFSPMLVASRAATAATPGFEPGSPR